MVGVVVVVYTRDGGCLLFTGGSLQSCLKKEKVDLKEKLQISIGAACGLEYLHKSGCIHRDIAARNCLYSKEKVVSWEDGH